MAKTYRLNTEAMLRSAEINREYRLKIESGEITYEEFLKLSWDKFQKEYPGDDPFLIITEE